MRIRNGKTSYIMYKACSRCGKMHDSNYICTKGKVYRGGEERRLRNTYKWACKSQEIRDKAQYLCEVCRDKGRYTYEGLEVHHIVKLSQDKDGLLDNNNLVCLCIEHHKLADAGKIDVDYLRHLADIRERGYPPTPSEKK